MATKPAPAEQQLSEGLTIPEVARLNKLSEVTVRRHVNSGKIPSYKVGGARRIRADVLAAIQLGDDGTDDVDTEIKRLVDLAPKLTPAQRDTIAALFATVSWWSVHEHVAPILSSVESWPMAGTPAWCALDDDDPVKTAALFDAAQHFALRVETCQQAHCDASREVAGAVDWSALGREINERADFYASRPWLRRVAS